GQATQAPAVDPSTVNVQVLNGTNVDGLAATTAQKLEAARYKISRVGNAARSYKTTTIFYQQDSQPAAQQIAAALFPGAKLEPANNNTSPNIHVTVVVGEDQAP
ncbi:MAG TPA: LytR C-terminal domain-containing protein, partial [Actinomycetota bacterium]|nr:LytR C-terminal domain-containing protein [Actinomycetota bacterium]